MRESKTNQSPSAPPPLCPSQKFVRPGTKHCNTCNKCVAGFDHHCVWLNTCIGERNYWTFFALLNTVAALLISELAIGVAVLIYSLLDRHSFDAALQQIYPWFVQPWGYRAALCVFIIIAIGLLQALLSLWAMHWVLLFKGATTWDMIKASIATGSATGSSGTSDSGSDKGGSFFARLLTCEKAVKVQPGEDGSRGSDGPILPISQGQALKIGAKKRVPISPFVAWRLRVSKETSSRHARCHGCCGGAEIDEEMGFDAAAIVTAAGSPNAPKPPAASSAAATTVRALPRATPALPSVASAAAPAAAAPTSGDAHTAPETASSPSLSAVASESAAAGAAEEEARAAISRSASRRVSGRYDAIHSSSPLAVPPVACQSPKHAAAKNATGGVRFADDAVGVS